MKKVLIFLVLISMPLISMGQNNSSITTEEPTTTVETSISKENTSKLEEKTVLKSETKAQILDLNYKKSIELISIKAYKKSLQIKVKTIKEC
jgi:hypothetical protein